MNYIERKIWLLNMKRRLKNQPILKVSGEGCQARSEFEWVGKVTGFKQENDSEVAVIEILKHNFSYGDNRDTKEKEIYTYPIAYKYGVINDIQWVNGVWILFT